MVSDLVPPIKTKHQDVWLTILKGPDDSKLISSTQVLNVLATSKYSYRRKIAASVGGTTFGFHLNTLEDSLGFNIFLDLKCLKLAKEIIDKPELNSFVPENGVIIELVLMLRLTHRNYITVIFIIIDRLNFIVCRCFTKVISCQQAS